MTFILMAIY